MKKSREHGEEYNRKLQGSAIVLVYTPAWPQALWKYLLIQLQASWCWK